VTTHRFSTAPPTFATQSVQWVEQADGVLNTEKRCDRPGHPHEQIALD
jgi:hypothetical protein